VAHAQRRLDELTDDDLDAAFNFVPPSPRVYHSAAICFALTAAAAEEQRRQKYLASRIAHFLK
jgi:hypothetical protein